MNKLSVVILCVLIVGVSLIIWQVKGAGAMASQGVEVIRTVTDTDDTDSRRQLLDIRIHIAQTMWQYDVPEKLTFYKSCLNFDEQYGEFGIPPCKQLDNLVLLEMRHQIDGQANQTKR